MWYKKYAQKGIDQSYTRLNVKHKLLINKMGKIMLAFKAAWPAGGSIFNRMVEGDHISLFNNEEIAVVVDS